MTNTVSKTISDETLSRIIQIESAGNPHAKARTSSATGLGQFLDDTWLGIVKRHRPDLLQGRDRAAVLALRTDPSLAIELLARFTEDNARALGAGTTDGDLYLAHFLGLRAAKNLLRAELSTPVAQIVGAAAVRANRSILAGKTAGEVRAWAAKRMAQSGKVNWVAKYRRKEPPTVQVPPPKVDTVPAQTVPMPRPGLLAMLWALLRGKPIAPAVPRPPAAAPAAASAQLRHVQELLATKGYTEVGEIDGLDGPRTRAAVRAFRAEHGIAAGDAIDDKLIAALTVAGPRQVSKARAEATAQDLREKANPQVKELDGIGWLAKALGLGSVIGALNETGIVDKAGATLTSAQEVFGTIAQVLAGIIGAVQWIVAHWWMFAFVAAAWILVKVGTAVFNLVDAFRRGILARAGK